ncbi:MAG: hypothetical protein ABIU97_00970 [Dehalococcoidia bacterium]
MVETLELLPFSRPAPTPPTPAAGTKADQLNLLKTAKQLAKEYYVLTGRPLGVTGEIAEFEAVTKLGLTFAEVRQEGFDATEEGPDGKPVRLQIKGRCMYGPLKPGARMGAIGLTKPWDAVLLVLLNADLDAVSIHRAERDVIEQALTAPGSKSRNERGQLGIAKFRSIGRQVWP